MQECSTLKNVGVEMNLGNMAHYQMVTVEVDVHRTVQKLVVDFLQCECSVLD